MQIILTALGLIPFALGSFMNRYLTAHPDSLPPFMFIAAITLLLWGVIAFWIKPYAGGTRNVVIGLNTLALLVLVLIGIQELILQAYWNHAIGVWTQLYFLPLLHLGFTLTRWSHSVFSAYCAAFLLMVGAALLGCKLRKT
ncbi:MAG: hypothetical protein J6J12_03475 [Oscillospiraceae bacterium]|nr:hypothetical protein [Oscillospiraceae bacterium]